MPTYRIAFSTMELDGKLVHGDPRWRDFNASFQNADLSAPAIAYMIDDGRAFTTCHKNNWRTSENFVCGQHLGIDFDSLSVEQALSEPFVEKYAAIVYATPSSTPDAPRCRAVFLLDTPIVQAANYVRAASALIWSFGGQADRQCKDAARFFYGSLASMPVRRDLTLPLAIVRDMIAGYEAIARQPRHRRTDYTPRSSDAQDAADLLRRLSPTRSDDYDTWITVGMALSTLGEEGLRLWDDWSSRSAKHVDGECERKWRSFDRRNGNVVTMATVAHWAQQDTPR